MEDKRWIQIFFEFLAGIFLMLPLIFINSEKTIWVTIGRVIYSFGIMLAMAKTLSIVYRIISYIFRRMMRFHQNSYWVLYFIFICLSVAIWNSYSSYFAKGYFVAEIIAYVLFMFWFLLDVHTTKCFAYISFLDMVLDHGIWKHTKYVDAYKNDISSISVRKDKVVESLEQYFPRKFLIDPLKDLRREIDFTHIDDYLQTIPCFQGVYKGIDGFLFGRQNINEFEAAVEHYLGNLDDDECWMDNEKELYDSYILEMEKLVTNIEKSGQKVEKLSELGFETNQFKKILEGDIADAGNNRKNIKQFWKMTKKIDKMRRRNYGRTLHW